MRLAALAAGALLAPTVAAAPPQPPQVVAIGVGHDRANGFVAGDGLVVTVAHVLDDRVPILVDGRRATVVRVDRAGDLALLQVAGLHGEALRLGGDRGTRLLDRHAPVVRRVRASLDGGPRRPALVVRARTARGDSGTPLITESGRVAGVLFARSRTQPTTAYAVDASAVARLLSSHSSP